ncbi:non-ribosomal peptide synthetase [Nonomuraea endophytica]|uniref:non-ribosomal peptide synthetase n=1 Tax=Nonomuraea endophytica TaxID=714136 RepID=UPI0037CC3C3C
MIEELLTLGRGEALPEAGRPAVHELVAGFARDRPAQVAVRCGEHDLTYAALEGWAGRIAARLRAGGVGRGDRVAVLAEPSTAMVAAALGVLWSGAAYVPIDPAQPDGRVAAVLADARPAAAVATCAMAPRLAEAGVPVIRAEDAWARGEQARDARREPGVTEPGDPAYLIYTSGSTGEPKGVLVEHAQLTAATLARHRVYPGAPVFLLVSPLAFDSSVAGLWGTLTIGGTVVVATADEVRDPAQLVKLVESCGVTRMLCVPSLYDVVLDAAERLGAHRLRTLATVIVAGEPLPEALVERHFARHTGPGLLVNEYGPTEATVWSTYRRFDAPGPVSIGGPVPGARLYVLDEELRPVPRGERGELFVAGAGVARGYFGRPEATELAFLPDPFEPGRMYRTGDLVRWNDRDGLDFLGRRDQQVKIRGQRVELGAVEAALRTAPGVRDAVAVAAGDRLTAFVLAAAGLDPRQVRGHVAERLPAVMVPARVEVMDAFPLTVNGKADRTALAARAPAAEPEPEQVREPRDATTAQVAAAWADVLDQPRIPLDVNFFDLGGHSLTMFHLQDALESHTGTRPSVVALFRHTTVTAQAGLIRDGGAAPEESLPDMREAAARRAHAIQARLRRAEREAAS